MSDVAHTQKHYGIYWFAWFVLLALTLLMLAVTKPAVLVAGVVVKATIILLWFMHLKFERLGLALSVVVGVAATMAMLVGLILLDARPS